MSQKGNKTVTVREIILSEHQPPGNLLWVHSWERGLDPWHPDAFKGIEGIHEAKVATHDGSARRGGWYAVDYCGNVVGWYPDGAMMKAGNFGQLLLDRVEGDFCYYDNRTETGVG